MHTLSILLHRLSVYRVYRIIVSDISLKTSCFGYISFAKSLGISSTTFMQCTPEATEFVEITQNKGHCAVQGHSRSNWYRPKAHILLPVSD